MRRQIEVWQEEHLLQRTFNRVHGIEPSGNVAKFADFLENQGLKPKETRVLDLGSGKGRNSVYLAKRGFQVTAADFVYDYSLKVVAERAKEAGVKIDICEMDFSENWRFPDEHFRAIVDCNGTICVPEPGRTRAIDQAFSKLQNVGYYMFYGVAPLGSEKSDPFLEPGGTLLQNKQFEKRYTKDELLKTYEKFHITKFEEQKSRDLIEGNMADLTMWMAIFQKL